MMVRAVIVVCVLPFAALLGACSLVGGSCPTLEALGCAGLQCANYQQDAQGCSTCACTVPKRDAQTVCGLDNDCLSTEHCDATNFCELPPGCVAGEDCAAVCFGRCVEGAPACHSDTDCPFGLVCQVAVDGEQAQPVAPQCSTDADCAGASCQNGACVVAPTPGTCVTPLICSSAVCVDGEVNLRVGTDVTGCGIFRCFPQGVCTGRDPAACEATPGCEAFAAGCAVTDACGALDQTSCGQNADCVFVDPNAPTGGGCAPEACGVPAHCAPVVQAGCLADGMCAAAEVCAVTSACGSGCVAGTPSACFDGCWTEAGSCSAGVSTCAAILDATTCVQTPGCATIASDGAKPPPPCDPTTDPSCDAVVVTPAVCAAVVTPCTTDSGCAPGAYCDAIGVCVVGSAAPAGCLDDADCQSGRCAALSVCACASGNGACAGCATAGRCVDALPTCSTDADCASDASCDLTAGFCGAEGVQPCEGVCRSGNAPLPADAFCLSAADCADGGACLNSDALCRSNPTSTVEACWGWCASTCRADAPTTAATPEGQCVEFAPSCVPPEFTPGC